MASIPRINPGLRDLRVPALLRDLPAFLIWRYEAQFEGDPKPRKVPCYANGVRRHGQQGSGADRGNLVTFDKAKEAAIKRGFDGVGFALMPEWGVTALDFDNCVVNGKLPPEVEQIVARTYAEYSPSGNGVRAIVRGDLGNHKSTSGPEGSWGFETFASNGFVTLTGDLLPETELLGHEDLIAPADAALTELCNRRFGPQASAHDPDDFMAGYEPRLGLTLDQMQAHLGKLDPGMSRDDWIKVGMALHHETEGGDEGFDLWNEWSESAHNYAGEEDLRKDWDSFERRAGPGRRQITFASVLKMVREEGEGYASPLELAAAAESATAEGFDGRLRPVKASALKAGNPAWLIKSIMPRTLDPVIIYGASTAGKSFVAIDMALAIARGVDWRGHRTSKGKVLYITAEGRRGFRNRIEAYCRRHSVDIESLDLDVLFEPINILQAEDVRELVKTLAAFGKYDLVVIDTLAQVTPGANENSGEDMSLAIANIQAVQQATDATIAVVHHAGKDVTRGSRGWSGLKAAAEAQIEILRDEVNNTRQIHIDKMKDGADGLRFGFALEEVVLRMDDDGDEVSSMVVVEADLPKPAEKKESGPKRGVAARGKYGVHVLSMVERIPGTITSMSLTDLVAFCVASLPFEGGENTVGNPKRDTRRQRVTEAIYALAKEPVEPPLIIDKQTVIFCTE